MSWRFRKSFKAMPGLKLNLTARGLSATIGASPLSLNVGPRGAYGNVGVSGTGVWTRQRLDILSLSPPATNPGPFEPGSVAPSCAAPQATPPPLLSAQPQVDLVRSASTEILNSASMEDLRKVLENAYHERAALGQEVATAEREHGIARRRYESWCNGFLFKRAFPQALAVREEVLETAKAKLEELREQLRLTTLATQIDMDPARAEAYYRMRDDFAALTECQKVWGLSEGRLIAWPNAPQPTRPSLESPSRSLSTTVISFSGSRRFHTFRTGPAETCTCTRASFFTGHPGKLSH
jgi:hypothetical protein